MNLKQLVSSLISQEGTDCTVTGLENDSRRVKAGDLFLAYPGAVSDGRLFINNAVAAGARAIAYDPVDFHSLEDMRIPCLAIPHLADHLSEIAGVFYNHPGRAFKITGITGTNGKTTIAYQLAQAHQLLGQKAAYIGTIGQGEVNQLKPLDNTTPDGLFLMKLFDEYRKQAVKQICMEVSSHALSQGRVEALEFNQALFTNLTLDHLDYHLSMQAYADAKAHLFARPELKCVIINKDDAFHTNMIQVVQPGVQKITYGMQKDCDVRAVNWHMDVHGTEIDVHSIWGKHHLKIKSIGQFNIYNSLAVFASLLASGYSPEHVIQVMSELKSAPGRMEVVADSPYVLVDYAHTPDALENVLSTLNQLKKGRLWVVFGCGGDRDKSKRPVMGKAASLYADNIVITSDNPRSEDPEGIINEIAQGISADIHVTKLINREEAIGYALEHVEKDDIVVIAGKGHEAWQQIGSVKQAYSDQEVVRRLMGDRIIKNR